MKAIGRMRWRFAVAVVMVLALVTPAFASGETEQYVSALFGTGFSLLPAVLAITLALITKEVYSSLFLGILLGAVLYAGGNFERTVLHMFEGGFLTTLSDGYNVGIIIFLGLLGVMVSMMNRAGGSAAFGQWAKKNVKSAISAQLATVFLGCLIFIDDYFNCLTVGSVMRPVTDEYNISRAKLAYLIDSTAAPICIIAPVSSWAAAVSSYVDDGSGLTLFIRAIPYNFYAIFTIAFMIGIVVLKADFGPMRKHEQHAQTTGDLFFGDRSQVAGNEDAPQGKGKVIDLVMPIIMLVICCVTGMIYTGGFFSGNDFVTSFSDCDASLGLMMGASIGIILTIVFYMVRRVLPFQEIMSCFADGFKAMIPAIMILGFAWTLKEMTGSLGAKEFVEVFMKTRAQGLQGLLPAIVFLVGCLLAFATGTSWGTFGILIPITMGIFPLDTPLGLTCMAACMAGGVCGDHCSPISDTTIMASAGAQCNHVSHVSTQLPYSMTVAVISFAAYLVAGFTENLIISLSIGLALAFAVLFFMRSRNTN